MEDNIDEILKYCKGKTHIMWAAKIVSLLLECDFRDAGKELENYFKETE